MIDRISSSLAGWGIRVRITTLSHIHHHSVISQRGVVPDSLYALLTDDLPEILDEGLRQACVRVRLRVQFPFTQRSLDL
jgi:hypothetical protein